VLHGILDSLAIGNLEEGCHDPAIYLLFLRMQRTNPILNKNSA